MILFQYWSGWDFDRDADGVSVPDAVWWRADAGTCPTCQNPWKVSLLAETQRSQPTGSTLASVQVVHKVRMDGILVYR